MRTKKNNRTIDDLRQEYDLRRLLKGGVRGKYAKRYHAGTNLVLLDPDVRNPGRFILFLTKGIFVDILTVW